MYEDRGMEEKGNKGGVANILLITAFIIHQPASSLL